jgi:ABC-type lipoprotein export system ATPase subunit
VIAHTAVPAASLVRCLTRRTCPQAPPTSCAQNQHAQTFCRPDDSNWRPFQQLSGGQQALAALALSIAAHTISGSSWFLCDEVDAALDVSRASQLGTFMRSSGTQFIVVSHKPQARVALQSFCLLSAIACCHFTFLACSCLQCAQCPPCM